MINCTEIKAIWNFDQLVLAAEYGQLAPTAQDAAKKLANRLLKFHTFTHFAGRLLIASRWLLDKEHITVTLGFQRLPSILSTDPETGCSILTPKDNRYQRGDFRALFYFLRKAGYRVHSCK
jgi:hypothetical protein